MKWPHLCVAALRMVMPPGLLADGILVVSMSGCQLTGSGKSGTPFARTHWANLRAADSCAGVSFALKVPGGCKDLHAATAFVQTAGVTLTPYDGNWPDASGSGKSPTPLVRMHSVNFTAFCRGVSVRAAVLVVLPVSATAVEVLAPLLLCAPPQPAPAAATTTTKPARGQSRFLMGFLPVIGVCACAAELPELRVPPVMTSFDRRRSERPSRLRPPGRRRSGHGLAGPAPLR